jgi:hypothetical protein
MAPYPVRNIKLNLKLNHGLMGSFWKIRCKGTWRSKIEIIKDYLRVKYYKQISMGVVTTKIDLWSLSANKNVCFKKIGHSVVTAKGAVVTAKGEKWVQYPSIHTTKLKLFKTRCLIIQNKVLFHRIF